MLDSANAGQFLARVLGLAESAQPLSREHFSVDGTLLEAWASQTSVRAFDEDDRDRPVDRDNTGESFHGERRSNATHGAVTDSDAGLRNPRHRGTALVDWLLTFACAAYNLLRLRRLLAAYVSAGRRAGCAAARATGREAIARRPYAH